MFRRLCKGQSTAEYAIVVGLVIAAAVAMQIYIKRQLQGKVRDAVNYNEGPGVGGANAVNLNAVAVGTQYEPYYQTMTDVKSTADRTETTQTFDGGKVTRDIAAAKDMSTREGTTNILVSPNN